VKVARRDIGLVGEVLLGHFSRLASSAYCCGHVLPIPVIAALTHAMIVANEGGLRQAADL
jgi:hypothetical protein